MRLLVALCACLCLSSGCALIPQGHRGLLFNPLSHVVQNKVLSPGLYYVGALGRVDDFDVTYSTRREKLHTLSSDRLALDLVVSIIFRPVVEELYNLDIEIGLPYYDEVIGPEFRTATRGVFARYSYLEVHKLNEKIEDEIEAEVRRRTTGKHIEISSVTIEAVHYAPEIEAEVRAKLVGEQEAIRKRVALQAEAERAKLEAEADLKRKQHDRQVAEEEAATGKVRAASEAEIRETRARAEATEMTLLAKAKAEQKRAEAQALTPLVVAMHAYDALAKLGGSGTSILLGDWSRVPAFLFPPNSAFHAMVGGGHTPSLHVQPPAPRDR